MPQTEDADSLVAIVPSFLTSSFDRLKSIMPKLPKHPNPTRPNSYTRTEGYAPFFIIAVHFTMEMTFVFSMLADPLDDPFEWMHGYTFARSCLRLIGKIYHTKLSKFRGTLWRSDRVSPGAQPHRCRWISPSFTSALLLQVINMAVKSILCLGDSLNEGWGRNRYLSMPYVF